MDTNDWILLCFVAVPIVASCVCRWHREKHNREWADMHAPLSDEKPEDRVEAILRAAEEGAVQCATCGFQNFRTKIFCVMCGNKVEEHEFVASTDTGIALSSRQPRRNVEEWSRKVDVEGRPYWYRHSFALADSLPTSHFAVVRFQSADIDSHASESTCKGDLQAVSASLLEEVAAARLVFEDPATADPTAGFSTEWKQDHHAHNTMATALQPLTHCDFPTRVANFTAETIARAAAINSASNSQPILFKVDRGDAFLTQSIEAFSTLTSTQAIAPIRVGFVGEPAIDAGGVYREWMSLMSESIVRPEAGIFTCVSNHDQTIHLNPHSREMLGDSHLVHMLAAGRLVGRALLDGNTLGFHLSQPLLKLVLGHPIGFDDLQSFDPVLHKSLSWLVENTGTDALDLDFTVCDVAAGGEPRVVQLIPGGNAIRVTDDNKLLYIDHVTKYRLVESVSSQLYAFLKGVHDIVPQELLAVFNADELDYVLCGSDDIDVADWERHTRYTQDLWHHPTRQWFWEIVREMSVEYQRRLLQFATGSSRPPLSGFAALTSYDGRLSPFTLVGRPLTDEGFVRSHSCFNRLVVPLCVNRNHLKRGLYALLDTDAYGFSMA